MRPSRTGSPYLIPLLALVSAVAQAGTPQAVAPGVWFIAGSQPLFKGSDVRENVVLIEMKDYLVVIDSGMKQTATDVRAEAKKLSTRPVRYVFLTHYHFDHTAGNAVWTEAGAQTMAFAGVNEDLRRTAAEFEPVRQVISGDSFALDDGKRRIEFHSYGQAHTRGDGVAYLPKERILITGDMVLNGPYNYLGDADLRNWTKAIRRLEELDVKTVLPGHGEPASKDLLRGQREFLEALVAGVQDAIKAGKTPEDLAGGLPVPRGLEKWAPEGKYPADKIKIAYAQLSR